MISLNARLQEAEKYYNELADSPQFYFDELRPTTLDMIPGVYAIFDRHTEEVLYVGKTTNLRQRLYTNHLMGNLSTARLKKYLINDGSKVDVTSKEEAKEYILRNCGFKYIQIDDMKKRGQVEGLMSFLLNVYYMDKEY